MKDDAHLAHLQGRIIALELMMRGFITKLAMEVDDPAAFVDGWRSSMLASLQQMHRPFDEAADEIWSQAIDALNALFDETQKRVHHLSR